MSENDFNSSSGEENVEETKKTRKRSRKESDSFASEGTSDSSTTKKSRRSRRRVAPTADSEGVKYRLTFLMDQTFKREFYREGATIEVPEHIFEAYKGRKNKLHFEKL